MESRYDCKYQLLSHIVLCSRTKKQESKPEIMRMLSKLSHNKVFSQPDDYNIWNE